jgi:hypothetical protein
MDANSRRVMSALPWGLAVVGLALPMVGSGFIGWPFVVGWLVLLTMLWWIRPLRGADRTTRVVCGVRALVALALLLNLGGFYLMPAVIAWLALVAVEGRGSAQSTPVISGDKHDGGARRPSSDERK